MKSNSKRKIQWFFLIVFIVSILISSSYCLLREEKSFALQNHDLNVESYYDCGDENYSKSSNLNCYDIEKTDGLGCHTDTCGNGREEGYSEAYLSTGCRNWQVMPLYSPFYKYCIDAESMSGLSEVQQKVFTDNIRKAVNSWNKVEMHDGSGKLVHLVEEAAGLPDLENTVICPIKYEPGLDDCIGKFTPVMGLYKIEIKFYNDLGTIKHELGHLLGLQDLDMNNNPKKHSVLMGYNRSSNDIEYQDIQGIAVANHKHTQHDFRRYAYVDGQYVHVCFYCDVRCSESEHLSGSQPFVEAGTCVHDFQPMVSFGERHWLKCTKCYKVIESKFYVKGVQNDGVSSLEITGLINSNESTITIPNQIGGVNVIGIADNAFYGNTNLKEVNFDQGSNLLRIGKNAFANCINIEEINLPKTIKEIGDSAFSNCTNLIFIPLSSDLEVLGARAFQKCSLLSYINFGANLSFVGNCAFLDCYNIKFTVSSTNKNFSAQDNILYDKNKTKIIASGKVPQSVVIPETVTEIAPYAFYGNTNLSRLYFYSYDVPNMDSTSFANTSFTAYVPYISQGDYAISFNNDNIAISFVQTAIHYISGGQTLAEQQVYFGSYLNDILLPELVGYEFVSWHRDEALQEPPVVKGVLWEEKQDVNLYAKWAVVEYDIYYDLDGGINSADNPIKYTINDDITFSAPTKTGYTFTEWRIDGQAVGGIDKGTHRDLVVCAFWQANTYTVSFDVGGGCPQVEPIEVVYDSSFNINVVPSKEGHVLEGWFDNDGVKYATAAGESTRLWNKTENTALYAKWSVKKYQIEINDNGSITWLGASGLSDTPCDIEYGAVLSSINLVPTFKNSSAGYKDGKIFDHFEYGNEVIAWTSVPDLGENGAIITIIPVWVLEKHTIYFDTSCSLFVEALSALYDTNITLPTVNRRGYRFNGWYTSKTGGTRVTWTKMPDLTVNEQNNGSCQLFARYELINYSITYVTDGGTNPPSNPTVFNVESNLTLTDSVKRGYTFGGWFSDANKTAKVDRIYNMSGNLTLYAKFTPKNCTVTLDRQGGINGTRSITVTFDSVIPSVSMPTRKGYTFKGYYTQVNGQGKQYIDKNMQGNVWKEDAQSYTLFACWQAKQYDVILHHKLGNQNYDLTIKATYGQSMPKITDFAPSQRGYAFMGYFEKENGEGKKYYGSVLQNDKYSATINFVANYYLEKAVSCSVWDVAEEDVTLYAYYKLLECDYTYSDICPNDRTLGQHTIHLIHGKTIEIKAKQYDGYVFKYFSLKNGDVTSSTLTYEVDLYRIPDSFEGLIYPQNDFSVIYEQACVTQGTLITLADGTQVPVESLTGNETLMVWNLLTGRLESSKILFIDKDPAQVYKVINLGFSDGTTVKIISEHGFWDYDLNKYVYLRQDASKYVGHWFNKGETRVQLTSVDVRDEYTTAYSPVTYGHLCYYVNGMLSMPGGIDGLFNIFEVDPDTMKINLEAMERDIARYGLYTYDEFAELVPVSEDIFNAFNGQYLKVAVGKGLITIEQLNNLAVRYAEFFVQ